MPQRQGIVTSVHTTVSVQAFNGLEHGMVGAFLWAFPRGVGLIDRLVDRLAHLFEAKTYSPEDTYAS